MARGGYRPGAGRPKGARSKRTQLLEEASLKAAAGGIMPLDFILNIMRDEEQAMERRIEAAKVAIGYCHPRLASVYQTESSDHKSYEAWIRELNEINEDAQSDRIPDFQSNDQQIHGELSVAA